MGEALTTLLAMALMAVAFVCYWLMPPRNQ